MFICFMPLLKDFFVSVLLVINLGREYLGMCTIFFDRMAYNCVWHVCDTSLFYVILKIKVKDIVISSDRRNYRWGH